MTKLVLLAVLAGVLALVAVDYVFNLRGNLTFVAFRDSKKALQVRLDSGEWKDVASVGMSELFGALHDQARTPGATWKTLEVRRPAQRLWQHVTQAVIGAEVHVVEFDPAQYEFVTSFREKFELTTARERLGAEEAVFAITANFRDPEGKPLGLVVSKGQQVSRPFTAWTGYFFVKDGRPWFGPKSLFEETPGVLTEASQGYPSVLKNHTVFSYVDLAPNKYFNGDRLTYRALAGVRQDGRVVMVLSGNGGLMNIGEAAELARKLNVQHATLLDGGKALQYSMRFTGLPHHFHAFNTWLDIEKEPLQPERSPVFIAVKRKERGEN
ncbi:phosphodiester glycosidase family protein [Phragmitibacter flavus]|uniref:Phosphodiester glycosidase family protein n=1 Tax=Phragmitibacter flavus TaxID=2576071 RepID=A0A5R8KBQ5_9BACT|nr:phosphodiester glycosidase family protein [Phragmitibacter flavus]